MAENAFLAVFASFLILGTTFLAGWAFGMMYVTRSDPPQLVLGIVV